MTAKHPAVAPDGQVWRPRWPKYLPRPGQTPPPRCLALVDRSGMVYPEPGVGFTPRRVRTWRELADILYEWDAACWTIGPVVDILGPDMLAELVGETKETRTERPDKQWSEPWVHREDSALIGVGVHRGSRVRWVATLDVWGFESAHTETQRGHVFRSLRDLFDAVGAGVRATPGGLGEASMVQWWASDAPEPAADPDSDEPPPMPRARNGDGRRWFPPARRCSHVLTHYGVGGRVDAYQSRQTFHNAVELDLKNAYASFLGRVPCGAPHVYQAAAAAHWLLPASAPREENATWYALVGVRIHRDMPAHDPLPIAYRRPTEDDARHLEWPTKAGVYFAWLWREEVEHIERRIAEGAPLEILGMDEAWVWREWSHQLAPWAAQMDALRRQVAGSDGEVARLVKMCIVAGVGHLAMPYTSRVLVTEAEAREGDTPWRPPNLPELTLYAREVPRRAANPQAWAVYAWMRCNLLIVETGHAEYLAGNPPLYVCTDAAGFAREPAATPWSADPAMGEYGRTEYPVLYLHGPGVMMAPDKIRSPGVRKSVSRQWLRRAGENRRPGERKTGRGADKREMEMQRWLELAKWYAEKHYPKMPAWARVAADNPGGNTAGNPGAVVYAADTEDGW